MTTYDEAAYEALGVLESLYENGDIPTCLRDIVAGILAKAERGRPMRDDAKAAA